MKIIKRVPWSHKFTCTSCKSELEAEAHDIRAGSFGGSYCENGDEGFYVTCVVCGEDRLLSGYGDAKPKVAVHIPDKIKDEARLRKGKPGKAPTTYFEGKD